MTLAAAIDEAKRAFGPVVREPGFGWWSFTTRAPGARLSTGVDRRDIVRCRNREILRYACVLLGWSYADARTFADQCHMHGTIAETMKQAIAWKGARDGGHRRVA